jgi:hypothetical protein
VGKYEYKRALNVLSKPLLCEKIRIKKWNIMTESKIVAKLVPSINRMYNALKSNRTALGGKLKIEKTIIE